MPDLPNRADHERELAAAILLLFGRQEEAYRAGSGLPIRPPAELIDALAATATTASEGLAEANGLPSERLRARAKQWAERYASVLSSEITDTSEEAREQEGFDVDEWRETWKNRAENIGITETTRATSMGEGDAVDYIESLTGKELVGAWYTENDAVVCEVCGPLHGTGPDVYDEVSPGGPPVHPRCRCWLEYEETGEERETP